MMLKNLAFAGLGAFSWMACGAVALYSHQHWQPMQDEQPLIKPEQNIEKRVLSSEQVSCLAENIYHEARGEGDTGMLAVAFVTVNRKNDGRYGRTICDVVHADKQFSWTVEQNKKIKDSKAYRRSEFWAKEVLENRGWLDPTNGATHYFNPAKANPKWQNAGFNKLAIGNHKFMQLATK